jgi:hypothetical protein
VQILVFAATSGLVVGLGEQGIDFLFSQLLDIGNCSLAVLEMMAAAVSAELMPLEGEIDLVGVGVVLFFAVFAVDFGEGVVGFFADGVEEGLEVLGLVLMDDDQLAVLVVHFT